MASTVETNSESLLFVQNVIDRGSVATLQLLIILVSMVLNMLDGFDVTAMSFTAHSIGEQMQLPPDELGIVFSVALAGMMGGAMFLAPLSDTIGRRRMILVCVAMIGLSMITTAWATSLWQLVVVRLITGLGVGAMLASLATITAEYTPEKYRSFAVMSMTAGYPLGATLGGFIAAPMLPVYGWQGIFIAAGAATTLMLVPIWFLVPESMQYLLEKRPANALQKINNILQRLGKPTIEALPARADNVQAVKANVFSLLTPQRRSDTLILWGSFFFCFICLYFLMSWIPKLVINSGLSEAEGIYAAVAFNGGGAIGIVALGWLSAGRSLSNLIVGFLTGSAACMIIFALASDALYLLLSLFIIGFLLQGGFTGLYAVAAKIYPTEIKATGVGWAIGLGRFGAVVGPFVGGLLIAAGISMETNFIIFALPLLISGFMAWKLAVR
jgi:benzoate transport